MIFLFQLFVSVENMTSFLEIDSSSITILQPNNIARYQVDLSQYPFDVSVDFQVNHILL